MINRRDLVFGMGCAAAAGGAVWMRPDNYVRLMPPKKLEDSVPEQFGSWAIDRGMGVVMPPSEGSLADRLYDEIMARAYYQPAATAAVAPVMCLITYGARQSDALQLHRPETCYPAVGFQLLSVRKTQLPIDGGISIPIVALTAKLGDRIEDVIYWTRVGEDLPQDAGEQRRRRLLAALAGNIGDGVLVRMSSVRAAPTIALHQQLGSFAGEMLAALTPALRRGLVGTRPAAAMG